MGDTADRPMTPMERYARFIVRHRVAVLGGVLVITALLASQLGNLHFEIRRRAQLPEEHRFVRVQNEIADRFGGETTLILGIVPRSGDIFADEVLNKIDRITRRLENLPGVVPGNLLSVTASRVKSIRPTSTGIDVRPLIEALPTSVREMEELRSRLLSDPLYARVLMGNSGRAAAIVVDFDDRLTDQQIHTSVEAAIAGERNENVEIGLAGAPLIRAYVAEYTREMAYLFPLAVLVIGLVHYEAFRTLQAMVLPLTTALLSVVWAMGFLGLRREPLDTWSALTPVIILGIAAGHAVQILKRYYEEYARGLSSEEAVVRSIVRVGPVTIAAGLIASSGFASLMSFKVASVRVFGFALATGIVSCLVIELTFTPACRALLPPPALREIRREKGGKLLSAALRSLADLVIARPRTVLLIAGFLVGISVIGMTRLRVDNSFRSWFPESSRLRVDDRLLNDHLAGTSTLTVLLEGSAAGDLEDPGVLRAVGDLQAWLAQVSEIGASLSLHDFVRQMHMAMTGEDGIPQNKALIAQYLLLYSMSGPEDLNVLIDPSHRYGVVRAYVKSDAADFGSRLLGDLEDFAARRFEGLPVTVGVAGGSLGVQTALNEVVVREKILNIIQIGVIIFALSALVLRSFAGGSLVLAPLAVAVALNLGIMGFTGIWLSVGTATVSAMAISIGADFAIYLVFRMREEIARGKSLEAAVRESLDTAGRAICFVASAVVLGYLALSLSGFRLWIDLGTLTALMMFFGALAALTIVPATVMVLRPRFLFSPT
jgi:hypothetical protein